MGEQTAPTTFFNPFEPGFAEWPYDQLDALRDEAPVRPSPLGGWQLFGYEDCFRLLREPGTSVEFENISGGEDPFERIAEEMGVERYRMRGILMLDPPDHTRIRKLVARVFTPKAIEQLRPRVEQLVDEALIPYGPGDEIELVETLAFPLPFQVISLMLGMPDDADTTQVRTWSHTLSGTLDPVAMLDPDRLRQALEASVAMRSYLAEVIAWKRANPADDLLSGLIARHSDGDALTDQELLDQLLLIFIAGHETTINLIGNGTLALVRHPEQAARLRDDPALVVNAVEECLRYDPPVQMTRRITTAPMTVGDAEIAPGELVLAMTAAANRDPARWGDDAGAFDIAREGANHHLAFGSGIHHCLGAALARVEGQVAIGRLVERFDLTLAGDPVHNGRIVLRGLDELPLRLTALS